MTWWSLDDWESDLNEPAHITLWGMGAASQPGGGEWTIDKGEALAVWASRGHGTTPGTGTR